MKKYISNSDISVSVTLPNGKSTRISFSALSNGTSVFYTSDTDIQWALEHHYKFGKLFRLAEETPDKKSSDQKKSRIEKTRPSLPKDTKKNVRKTEKSSDIPASSQEGVKDEPPGITAETAEEGPIIDNEISEVDESLEPKEVVVSDMDAAKDYLAENFDVVRTKLKSEESIREAALSFGIIFKYL